MVRRVLLAALLMAPSVASAQDQATKSTPPTRIRSFLLNGTEKCPEAQGDEIVICLPAEEPYRIPKRLRDEGPIPAKNQSWVNRAATIDEAGRTAAGLPGTCSPQGAVGAFGCTQQLVEQWRAERREGAQTSAAP